MAYWRGKGRRGNTREPPRLRLPLPDDDVFRRAVAEAHADGHAGLVGRLEPLAQAPRLDDAAPPGRALACVSRSRRWRAMGTRRVDCVNASTLKKTDAGKDRRARACRRTARPRAAVRRGPLCEYDLNRRNAAAEKRRDAGSRRGDGQGSSGTSGTVRGDDVRRVRTERTEPAPRSATRDGPDATESASSSSSSAGSAEGAAAGATASSRSRAARACRSRNSTPAASSAASAEQARFAHRGSASSAPAP